jgi:hypothetical protein
LGGGAVFDIGQPPDTWAGVVRGGLPMKARSVPCAATVKLGEALLTNLLTILLTNFQKQGVTRRDQTVK